MAQPIAAFPPATRRSKYDTDQWFDGRIWKLVQGEDFVVPIASFRGSLYNQANKKGFEITTRVNVQNGQTALIVQKTGDKEAEAEEPAAPKSRRKNAKAAA